MKIHVADEDNEHRTDVETFQYMYIMYLSLKFITRSQVYI